MVCNTTRIRVKPLFITYIFFGELGRFKRHEYLIYHHEQVVRRSFLMQKLSCFYLINNCLRAENFEKQQKSLIWSKTLWYFQHQINKNLRFLLTAVISESTDPTKNTITRVCFSHNRRLKRKYWGFEQFKHI